MVGGGAGKESENYGSFLVLNKDTKLCPPLPRPVSGSCSTFYIFCLCSHLSFLVSLLCLALE